MKERKVDYYIGTKECYYHTRTLLNRNSVIGIILVSFAMVISLLGLLLNRMGTDLLGLVGLFVGAGGGLLGWTGGQMVKNKYLTNEEGKRIFSGLEE